MRTRDRRLPAPFLLAVHDAALLGAAFYLPFYWGAFNTNVTTLEWGEATAGFSGLSLATLLLSIATLAALIWRWLARRRPAVLPNAIHLPALLFLTISVLATFTTVNLQASLLELDRLVIGVLFFALIANRALLPAGPRELTLALFAATLPLLFFATTAGEERLSGLLPSTFSWLDVFAWLAAGAVVGLWHSHRETPDPVRRWVETLVLAGGVVAVVALKEKAFNTYVLRNETWQVFSTFFNPNNLAGFLGLLLPVACALAAVSHRLWQRALFAFVGLAMLGAMVPTGSKGAFLGLVVSAGACALLLTSLSRRPKRARGALLGVAAVLVVSVVLALAMVPAARAKAAAALSDQNASNMFRILTWKGTVRMAVAHPVLGVGPGGFESAFGRYALAGYTRAAHEAYLQVAGEQGFVGAAVFLWLLGAVVFTGWRVARDAARAWETRVLAIGAVGGLVVFLVHSLLDYDWYIGAIGMAVWLLAGLLAHLAHGRNVEAPVAEAPSGPTKGKRRRTEQPGPAMPAPETGHRLPWPRGVAGGLAAVVGCSAVLAGLLVFASYSAAAQHAKNQGDRALALANEVSAQPTPQSADYTNLELARAYYGQAVEHYQRAVADAPLWATAHEVYAKVMDLGGQEPATVEREYRKAIAAEPMSFQFRLSLARFLDVQGRWPQAVDAYQEALRYFPLHTRARRYLADLYRRMGEEANSVRTYQELIALESQPVNRYRAIDFDVDENYAFAHYELGRVALARFARSHERGLLAAAADHLNRCLAIIAAYRTGGEQLDRMFGQVHMPRNDRSLDLNPLEAKAHLRLATALRLAGRKAEAAAQKAAAPGVFARYPKLYPDPSAAYAQVRKEMAEEDAGGRR